MPIPNARLQVLLTGDPDGKRLRITDVTSGIMLAEIQLDLLAQAELHSARTTGSVDGVPAWIAPDLDRVGKHNAHATVYLRTVTSGVGAHQDQVLKAWANMAQRAVAAYSHNIARHGGGRTSVRFVSYHETEALAAAWQDQAHILLDELRPSAPGGDE